MKTLLRSRLTNRPALFVLGAVAALLLAGGVVRPAAAATPDLAVTLTTPLYVAPGDSSFYVIFLENRGTDGAKNIDLTSYLSDGTLTAVTPSDPRFRCFGAGTRLDCSGTFLAPGERVVINVAFRVPTKPGEVAIKAIADPYSTIVESDETNNSGVVFTTVS
jgi:uncharacterized repeat protein (TIGR01451 family)